MNQALQNTGTFLGHPKGLFICFLTEMWERFSYYGMRALLILYLTKHWEFTDTTSYLIYAAYTSLVYITPVLGGCLLYTSPSPRDMPRSRMPSSA